MGFLCLTSCEKEVENYFYFSAEGGPYSFYIEVDGSSLMIRSGEVSSKYAVFYKDGADPDNSDWVAELDWITVFYKPARKYVHVAVRENTTGKNGQRGLRLSGTVNRSCSANSSKTM